MALYVPQARRRRRLVLSVAGATVLGLAIGAVAGRVSAPTVHDRVDQVQTSSRDIAAGLRVVALHTAETTAGAGGTDLVLERTGRDLAREFERAPWISGEQRSLLLADLNRLRAQPDKATEEFGRAVDAFATTIENVFRGRFAAPSGQ